MSAAAPRKRVLIVDDERDFVELLSMRLEAHGGFEVAKAHDGEEAMAKARQFFPQIVLLDKLMPRMGGLEVCQGLRADPATSATTVVLMSAELKPDSHSSAYAAGANFFVAKPFEHSSLIALLGAL